MSRRIRNPTAYYDAVERNQIRSDQSSDMREYDYWGQVVRAIIKVTGGDGRLNWEKGHEECVRHTQELEAKYGKPREGFRSQSVFKRNVCDRAHDILRSRQKPGSVCSDNIMQFYTPFPSEEDMNKAVEQAMADGLAKHEAFVANMRAQEK